MKYAGPNRAKKSLGQNFLTDSGIIQRILQTIHAGPEQSVIEIGPGRGAITEGLIDSGCRLHCIEYDTQLCQTLGTRYGREKNFSITEADILRFDWSSLLPVNLVVGNLPYNISSQILLKMFEDHQNIDRAVIMLQKEMGDRVVVGPGSRTYGILSVYTAFYGDAKMEFIIPPEVFTPRPKIQSVLLSIDFHRKTDPRVTDRAAFHTLIRTAFNQRRKTLRNSLKKWYSPELDSQFNWQLRPEALSLEAFITLYELLSRNSSAFPE